MAAISPTATARARDVLDLPGRGRLHLHPVLSADRLLVRTVNGTAHFHLEMGLVPFTVTVFVLGFFMALGKAAVYKHIPVYYPNNVGAVGGLVGMIGGLGGFVLPIAFGALNDLTGMWTSCFMLLFVLVDGSLVWMHVSIRHMERGVAGAGAGRSLPQLPEMQEIHKPEHVGALSGAVLTDWRPEDKTFWETHGPRHRAAQPVDLDPGAAAVLRGLAGVVGGRRQAAVGRVQVHHRSAVLARGLAGHLRRDAAHLLLLHGADLRRPPVDHAGDLVADDPGRRHRLRRAEPGHALSRVPGAGAAVRLRRRQLRLLDGQHLLLLPALGEGQRARAQCRPRQSRRQRRAVRGAARHHRRRVRLARRRPRDGEGTAGDAAVAAERRLHLGAVHRRERVRRLVRHERHRSAKASFAEQAVIFQRKHNWIMCWLYTGTFGSFIGYSAGFPLLAKTQFPEVDALQFVFLGPLVGALSRSATGWIADRWGGGRVTFWVFI